MHKIEKEVLCTVLPEFFEAREYIELAYLFGSTAEGKEGPLSDTDIGIYLSAKLTKEERIEKRLELIGEVSTLLNTDNLKDLADFWCIFECIWKTQMKDCLN